MISKFAKIFVILVFFTALAISASAANIHGVIYDLELNKADNSIVSINTSPKQQIVAKQGEYSFIVPDGSYNISAKVTDKELIVADVEEVITVIGEGTYVLDLILFPNLDEETLLLEETEEEIELDPTQYLEERTNKDYYIAALILVIVLIIIIFYLKSGKKNKDEKDKTDKEEQEHNKPVKEKDEADEVIDFIKKQGKRTTQKEIRKAFPQSEAKISLILAELEEKGVIKKIKKGRGNIIILK